MAPRKFMGKSIRTPARPWPRGSREVMASIWEDYLAAILQFAATSSRFQIFARQIDESAGFKEIYDNWNTLPVPARAAAWQRLMTAAREQCQAVGDNCIRCGECCTLGSPTLLTHDLPCFSRKSSLTATSIPCGPGEQVTNREGQVEPLQEERLKVREVPGSRQCWFLRAADNSCRIYETARSSAGGKIAGRSRRGLPPRPNCSAGTPVRRGAEVWELISEHQKTL